MTSRLAERAGRVIAIELDTRLAALLRKAAGNLGNVEVVEGDVLSVDFESLTQGKRFSVYGNLPYYITSPILHRLFEHADRISAIHIVVQSEVAVRIAAQPGGRVYGFLSVVSQWFSRPELVLRIPRGAFEPPPKVDSALVSLRMPGERATQDGVDETAFLDFSQGMFRAKKEKHCGNNLRGRLGSSAGALLREAQIPDGARAEQLSISQFMDAFCLLRKLPGV